MENFGLLVTLQLSKPLEISSTWTAFFMNYVHCIISYNVTQSVLYRCAQI